jgi:predicted small lipoprotein YifL
MRMFEWIGIVMIVFLMMTGCGQNQTLAPIKVPTPANVAEHVKTYLFEHAPVGSA